MRQHNSRYILMILSEGLATLSLSKLHLFLLDHFLYSSLDIIVIRLEHFLNNGRLIVLNFDLQRREMIFCCYFQARYIVPCG